MTRRKSDPKIILDRIAEVSKNARAIWFALLGLLAFVGVTLMGHEDANFFASGAETQLPLIDIRVPARTFFWVAPVLVALFYAYLNLYLLSLWEAIADAREKIDDKPLSDRVFPSLISQGAIVFRSLVRPDVSSGRRTLQRVTALFSAAMIWLLGVLVLALLWWWSMPAHEEWMTLWIGIWLWGACIVGFSTFRAAWRMLKDRSREKATRNTPLLAGSATLLLLVLVTLSWDKTEGGILRYTISGAPVIPLYPADLREAVLTERPDNWEPYGRWLRAFEKAYRKEKGIDRDTELAPAQHRAFWAEARDEWAARLDSLTGPQLRERDLRNADMRRAVLPRADLRGARLDGADLAEAELQGVKLDCWEPAEVEHHCANLEGASLRAAKMQGASLRGVRLDTGTLRQAELQGADLDCWEPNKGPHVCTSLKDTDLRGAKMQGANLFRVRMQNARLGKAVMAGIVLESAEMEEAELTEAHMPGANLFRAQMQATNLLKANLQGAYLRDANLKQARLGLTSLQGADLARAQLREADLRRAWMQGANLILTRMNGVDLGKTRLDGAVLRDADLGGADCSDANFLGALLHTANMDCRNLTQAQLDRAVGDSGTLLPDGLTVLSCIDEVDEDIESALA